MNSLVYSCNICPDKNYTKRDSYRKHMRTVHKENFAEKNLKCAQDDCQQSFFTITAYREHLTEVHSIEMVVNTIRFETENDFLNWQKDFMQKSNERYVKNTGDKDTADGTCSIYDCQRSGFERKKSTDVTNQAELLQGSPKLNGRCPSQMILTKRNGYVEVTHYTTHTHPEDVKHVKLSEKTCETIAGMMKAGFTYEYILKYYKAKPINHRDHFVEEKDLRRIADRYHLTNGWRQHFEDAKSVHLFVEQNPNIVLYYQPENKEIGQELILVLQSERQVKYVQEKREFRVICTDSTHNVGAKKKMATLMTVDEEEEGVVLAFCICESENVATMKIFYAAVRDKVGFKIKTDCFLSDDANAFFNAWCAEMIQDTLPQKRLCAWHVNKNWTTHLSQIPDVPVEPEKLNKLGKPITKRSHCKTLLFSLRSELDLNVFKTKMDEFGKLLEEDSAYEKFKDYFNHTYKKRVEQWAYAYLPLYGGYNTNMYLESWHSEFKRCYLDGVTQRRLDFVLDQLIKFDQDELEEEIRRNVFGRRRNKRSAKVLKCHKVAVEQTKQLKYSIKREISEHNVIQFFFENEKAQVVVTEIAADHNHKCIYTCPGCHTCIHRYICSCEERRVRRNYCHHLCAIGQDKKLLFGFNEQESNHQEEKMRENEKCGHADFPEDWGDCDNDYETDDAPEIEETVTQEWIEKLSTSCEPQLSTTPFETLNNLMKDFHAEVVHAASEQPERQKEFYDVLMENFKRFKQIKYSNINQIAEFEVEKGRKRAMEKQVRRSPKKKKRNS